MSSRQGTIQKPLKDNIYGATVYWFHYENLPVQYTGFYFSEKKIENFIGKILIFLMFSLKKGTSRQRSGKGAIRKRFPLQKPRWEKNKLTIRYLYHETYRKPNEQLFSQ